MNGISLYVCVCFHLFMFVCACIHAHIDIRMSTCNLCSSMVVCIFVCIYLLCYRVLYFEFNVCFLDLTFSILNTHFIYSRVPPLQLCYRLLSHPVLRQTLQERSPLLSSLWDTHLHLHAGLTREHPEVLCGSRLSVCAIDGNVCFLYVSQHHSFIQIMLRETWSIMWTFSNAGVREEMETNLQSVLFFMGSDRSSSLRRVRTLDSSSGEDHGWRRDKGHGVGG